jgi:hypothetical protein
MPRRDANDTERLSKFNGILLSANLDALFDKHLISFKDDGTVMVSPRFPKANETSWVSMKPIQSNSSRSTSRISSTTATAS